MSVADHGLEECLVPLAVRVLHAYHECSDAVQEGIREMLAILEDPEAEADEREMAMATLADALFPNPHKGQHGMDLEESESDAVGASEELRGIVERMDREEAVFAERLAQLMKEKGLTQTQLAERIGVGQSAISNMLNRNCRPQRRTVLRLAEALSVSATELWPETDMS